jgi:transitional endoplasmic reticulum ATPase
MARRTTRERRYVRLPEKRIHEIDELVAAWPYETRSFMRARLNQFKPPSGPLNSLLETVLSLLVASPASRHFQILKDPGMLTDWQARFEVSGQSNPQEAWNKILEKEVSTRDYQYLLAVLDRELGDIHIPIELKLLFEKIYRAHIRKEYLSDPEVPKAPLILVTGPSGSGKTATMTETIEKVIFGNEVVPEIDLQQKKEEVLAREPFWKTLEQADPTLAYEISRTRRLKFYKRLSRVPVIRALLHKRISRNLSELEEQGIQVDYSVITPNDYQTALAGEPGNYLRKALGDPRKTAIRHIEEAHSAFGKADARDSGPDRQQRTLIDTSNIIIDEITNGRRDCLLIATTDQPERLDAAIYRRFVEKGKIIDLSDFWKNADNLREVVRIELQRCDIRVTDRKEVESQPSVGCLRHHELDVAVSRVFAIFSERTLKITPAYVRKLIHSIVEMKRDFHPDYLEDAQLVRQAFELVARNTYGDLYKKMVDQMDRNVRWEEYVGGIKDLYSEMANNCLHYGVSEEKGLSSMARPGAARLFWCGPG